MGNQGSQQTSRTDIDTTVTNRNELYNQIINNVVIENTKGAVFSQKLDQVIDIQNSQNIIIKDFHMKQVGQMNADVAQNSLTSANFSNQLAQKLFTAAETTIKNNIEKNMKNEVPVIKLPGAGGATQTDETFIKNKVENIQRISNIVETGFKNIDIQKCAVDANARQALVIANSQDVILASSSMEQTQETFARCIQGTGVNAEILGQIFTEADLNSKTTAEDVVKVQQEVETVTPLDFIGDAIGGIFTGATIITYIILAIILILVVYAVYRAGKWAWNRYRASRVTSDV